jgi:hypothetical protein
MSFEFISDTSICLYNTSRKSTSNGLWVDPLPFFGEGQGGGKDSVRAESESEEENSLMVELQTNKCKEHLYCTLHS